MRRKAGVAAGQIPLWVIKLVLNTAKAVQKDFPHTQLFSLAIIFDVSVLCKRNTMARIRDQSRGSANIKRGIALQWFIVEGTTSLSF